ncbi:hypothetical protein [Dyadobacter sp. NIV53]|uniref:hypothetical protein n=1 Tax=Dyadobacter sp. NIV53 TaxID=2861765 RepID=UPI001C88AFE2|nr:hypothetical protein [Dyadobacter sp. NIV53]
MAGTRIKEERFSFIDPQTGKTILVYEPESNDENKTVEDVSKLTFYISPLCLFNVAGNLPKPIFVDNAFRYTFELKCYPQRIIDYAAEMTTRRLKGQIGGAVISSGKVSPLPIQSIEFKSSLSGVEFEPLVSDSNDSALGDLELVVVKVSQPYKEIFENIVTDPVGLKVQVGLKYNVLNTQDATLTWSVEDIQSTLAYKDLLQAGGTTFQQSKSKKLLEMQPQLQMHVS